MLWYVLERYVYCDLGKSHLTEGTESNPPLEEQTLHFTKLVNFKKIIFNITFTLIIFC